MVDCFRVIQVAKPTKDRPGERLSSDYRQSFDKGGPVQRKSEQAL